MQRCAIFFVCGLLALGQEVSGEYADWEQTLESDEDRDLDEGRVLHHPFVSCSFVSTAQDARESVRRAL